MLAINATVNRANTIERVEKLKGQDVCMDSAGSLFTAGLAVCLGSCLSIIYLECIRLLADSVFTKNESKIWGIFAVFSASIIISALLLCFQNSKALTIKQRLIESLEQNAVDNWLSSNDKSDETAEKMLPIIRNDIFTYSEQLSGIEPWFWALGFDPLPPAVSHYLANLRQMI